MFLEDGGATPRFLKAYSVSLAQGFPAVAPVCHGKVTFGFAFRLTVCLLAKLARAVHLLTCIPEAEEEEEEGATGT